MSRYEQVCDLIRQRRQEKILALQKNQKRWTEDITLAVVEDALIELGPLFKLDADACRRLMNLEKHTLYEKQHGLLMHQYDYWPLQSEHDA
jgi:hypothetical protein